MVLENTTNSNTDKIASTFLGKKVDASTTYNPELLVAVPRFENRIAYNIKSEALPFVGWDVWHAFEFSSMTEAGIPVTRVLKIKYNCENDFIIESKSLKLYLNSFNMSRFGTNTTDCLEKCKQLIERDLSKSLKTDVFVNFLDNTAKRIEIYSEFKNIMNFIDETNLSLSRYKESPEVLNFDLLDEKTTNYLMFDSLRSNCRVTHQPDFGDIFIYYKSCKHINESSLLEYLVSFRSEYHFHEECCEMIYKRLFDILNENDELFVSALYTRRGGIDICPSRWSRNCSVRDVEKLLDLTIYARNGIKG